MPSLKRGIKILILGADSEWRRKVQVQLERAGLTAIPANDVRSAAMLALSQKPGLILVEHDVSKRRSAFDAYKVLKEKMFIQPIPIIILLPEENQTDRIIGLELGAEDCLSKTSSSRELVLRIKRTLLGFEKNLRSGSAGEAPPA